MKTFLLLLLPLGLSALYSAAQHLLRTAATIAQLNQSLNRHFLGHNLLAAAGLYADDFVLTADHGQQGKAATLGELFNPALRLDVNETTDVAVSVHGRTAVLTGLQHQRGQHAGRVFDRRLRVTNTWWRHQGTWQLLASHATEARP